MRLYPNYIEDLKPISFEMARIWALINTGVINSNKETLQIELTTLLINAFQTIFASIQTLRAGYRLQPGILIRSAYETLSTVLYLFKYPSEIIPFKKGTLKSTKTIETAKEFIPVLGPAYGFFSNNYVHISEMHTTLMPVMPYRSNDIQVKLNIAFIRMVTIVLYMVTELVFLEYIDKPRYWQQISESDFKYNPSNDEQEWLRTFLLKVDGFDYNENT